MADKTLEEYARTAAGNGVGVPPDWPQEGWTSDQVNNFIRAFMAAVKLFWDDPSWVEPFAGTDESWVFTRLSDTELRIAGPRDVTGQLLAERRVKFTDDVAGEVFGWITVSGYSGGNNDVTVELDAGIVSANTVKVEYSAIALKRPAFISLGTAGATIPLAEDITTMLGQALPLGTAATKDFGGATDELPQNSDLGSASLKDVGLTAGKLPMAEDVYPVLVEPFLGSVALLDSPYLMQKYIATENTNSGSNSFWEPTDWPAGMNPGGAVFDGIKAFRLWVRLQMQQVIHIDWVAAHMGATGDETDFEVARDSSATGTPGGTSEGYYILGPVLITPLVGDVLTVVIKNDGNGSTRKVKIVDTAEARRKSILIIEELWGEE